MERTSFNSNPSFGMSLEEKQRYRLFRDNLSRRKREESHISNPSFDMHRPYNDIPSNSSSQGQRQSQPTHQIPINTRVDPNRFPKQRSSHYELYAAASDDDYLGGHMIPPTPAPTNVSEEGTDLSLTSSSSLSSLPTSSLNSALFGQDQQDETSQSQSQKKRRPLHLANFANYQTAHFRSQKPSLLNYANFVAFLASATVHYLRGPKVEEVLSSHATLLTPAYFVSVVSGILIISTGVWAISQLLGESRHHQLVVNVVSWWYIAVASLQMAWYYLFSLKLFAYSLSVMLVQLGCLLFGLQPRISQVPAQNPPEYVTLKLPFDLYIAWTIASSAIQINVAAYAWKLKTLHQIVLAGVSLFGVFSLAIWFVLQTSGQWAIPCLLAWTCLGISVELERPGHLVSMVERYSSTTITSFRFASSAVATVLVIATVIRIAMMRQETEEIETFKKAFEEHRSTGTVSTAPRTPVVAMYKLTGAAAAVVTMAFLLAPNNSRATRVAMIGNSMMYYNDLPRVLEAMSERKLGDNNTKTLYQDSSLHGDADFYVYMQSGNGMYKKWQTRNARIWERAKDYYLYDWGACTPEQLLMGYDARLEAIAYEYAGGDDIVVEDNSNGDQNGGNNEGAAAEEEEEEVEAAREEANESEDHKEHRKLEDQYSKKHDYGDDWNYDDRIQQEVSDINPCHVNLNYYKFYQEKYEQSGPPKWDYVLMNDNTRSPCCTDQRATSMEILKDAYLPLILKSGATPIFLLTYGYWASARDMSGLIDIPTYTSYTYAGYRAYVEMLSQYLPKSQKPRIAPVGLAFLLIYEEKPSVR